MKDLIQKLTQTPGPSGYESAIRSAIREEVEPYANNISVDTLGNLIVRIGQKSAKGLRILVAAHMDEIGVIVSHVEKNGLVRFSNIGFIITRYLAGSRVRFLNGARGMIDSDKQEEPSKIQSQDKYFIDTGAASDKESPVKVGELGVFDRSFLDLGKRVVSKAMDDRISCAAMVEVIKQVKSTPHELVFVFSTQEEVGTRGAQTAAYALEPDLTIAIDVTPASTLLGVEMQVELGAGPAIKVRDVGMMADPRVVDWMTANAKKAGLPFQLEVLDIGSTDARAMQVSRAGTLSGALSIPCRYVHSPSEMVDMDDYGNTIKLLVQLLSNPTTF